jgi:hypothetical protein
MQLISALGIRYLRSIYKIRLTRLSSVNILSGRNDAGKSNVLKALNLFFNGDVDWQRPVVFYQDFSSQRLEQVRRESIKGKQFISVAIDFLRPDSYKGSLPSTFRVTRTWFRDSPTYSETSNLDAASKPGRLPSTPETGRRFLQIFLNRVHYEYIPAVKDRAYFEHLLARLQSALLATPTAADPAISQVATTLAQHIQGKIVELQADFQRATGIASAIEPPGEFASLFQAFRVTTAADSVNVPLALRGDGIQARYIPSVLNYISQRSADFFIWGFEEPENSLEYPRVLELARDFEKVYSKNAQIFVTTHSPVLTALRGIGTTCTRIYKSAEQTAASPVWPEPKDKGQLAELNEEMGLLRIQEELHGEFVQRAKEISDLQSRVSELTNEIAQYQLPLVLTEGPTDVQILTCATSALRPAPAVPFLVRSADPAEGAPAGGAGGVGSLARAIESLRPAEGRKAIAVFDRDRDGIRQFDRLSANFQPWQGHNDIKAHVNGLAFAILLPVPPEREPEARLGTLSIEFMFPDEILERRTAEGRGLVLARPPLQAVVVAGQNIPLADEQLNLNAEDVLPWIAGARTIVAGKDVFATQIVPACHNHEFAAFEPLLQAIEGILQ